MEVPTGSKRTTSHMVMEIDPPFPGCRRGGPAKLNTRIDSKSPKLTNRGLKDKKGGMAIKKLKTWWGSQGKSSELDDLSFDPQDTHGRSRESAPPK